MARIAESELERLKAEVSVARLAEAGGIKLEKRGKDLVGACPFHADDSPSLTITPDKNLFHCFGCGAAGGPIDWVMKKNGVSFRHAVELLREGQPATAGETVKHSTVRSLPPPVSFDADDQALLDQVVGYYHETLKRSPEALGYLQRRGIDAAAAVERFKLGFADRTLGLRLPEKNRKAGAEIRTRLMKIGLYRESGHEHFNGSLVIPILDAAGHATEVYGRKVTEGLRAGTPLHLYLPGPHKGVWNLDGLQTGNGEVILCEALIDALTFWCAGYRNVTAAYGVEGFTPDHLAAFRQHGIRRVLIAFDRDDAGERGTAKVSERLLAEGFDCYRVQFPKGLDANAYALKLTPASKSLGLLIRKAEWLGNGTAPSAPTSSPVDTGPAIEVVAAKEETITPPGTDTAECEIAADVTEPPITAESAAQEVPSLAAIDADAHAGANDDDTPTPADVLPASVLPAQVTAEPEAEVSERDITIRLGDRRYRVRGFDRNLAVDVMKVNLLAAYGDAFHVDTFDLYSAKARGNFIQMAAGELRLKAEIVKGDLGKVLLKLEALQDERIAKTLTPEPAEPTIDLAAQDAALAYLRSPNLLDRILADFETCGLVGEATNKLVAYLAAISRKLASPLAILVQSSSAAGKSSLMDAVLAFVPEEERVRYSALTGQALYYMGETSLKHRILAICEEEGANRASYALKLLQSEGEITIASTAKDADTGNLVTQEYRVEGPVMIFLTTTAIAIDEELMNRCLVLSVDEGRVQTEAIHRLQRKKRTLEGLIARAAKDEIIARHRNMQRLLRPLAVVNPYADRLSFLSDKTRTRRDHEKYLTLIDAIALLHQHQRPIKKLTVPASGGTTHHGGTSIDDRTLEYVEVTLEDIAAANRMAHEVLGRSTDELPPQTRGLLKVTCSLVAERCAAQAIERADLRFTRRELRERAGLSNTQIGVHLTRLVELEYVIAHRGGRGTSFVYELLYDGSADEDEARLSGLIDVDSLRSTIATTASLRGAGPRFKGSFRPQNGAITEGCRVTQNGGNADAAITSVEASGASPKTHILEPKIAPASYTNGSSHTHARPSSLAASSLAAGE